VTRRIATRTFPFVLLLASAPLGAGTRVPPVASYTIEATIDRDHRITGKETVRFTNRTARAFPDLALHLYLNGFRNSASTWLKEVASGSGVERKERTEERWFGYSEINRIALEDGTDLTPAVRFAAPDDGNADDRTLAIVALPRPVLPGETLVFTIDFSARFPRAIARTGWKDDYVLGAQWFPKLCKAGDAGWNAHQFHSATEFFADFGDYDVTLTIPGEAKGKLGATGVLKEETALAGGMARARFVAEDVHDFAFTYSPRFEVHRDHFTYSGLPNVDLILLLQPDHRRVKDRYFRAVKEGLAHYGKWYVPYPYPSLTVVDPPHGSSTGGMEYPTLFTGGASWLAPATVHSPESVTVHEFGHQVFYGLLASNEFEEAHLDEGFNTYATHRTLKAAYGDPLLMKRFFGVPFVFREVRLPYPTAGGEGALDWQAASRSDASSVPTFRGLDSRGVRVNAYTKTALTLASAERTLGEDVWGRVLKTYAQRFAFRHPTAADFRGVVREVGGEGADRLFREAWETTHTFDYAVSVAQTKKMAPPVGWVGEGEKRKFAARAKGGGLVRYESSVVVRRMGEAVWPVDVELRFKGGRSVRKSWDGVARWVRYRAVGPRLLEAVVDPDRKCLLDVNVLNNGRRTEPDRGTASAATHRLRFWAQNLLELAAALGWAGRP
jgi:hypothetical protein